MKPKLRCLALIIAALACLFTGFSTAEDYELWDLIEPLGGATSSDALIVKKSRIIIAHQEPDNTHRTKTWRGQSADVEENLSETGEDYGADLGGDWFIFGMGSTAGTVRESFTLDKEFYGAVSYDNLPKSVICNTYLVRDRGDLNKTSIFIQLVDQNDASRGGDRFIELKDLPKPVYRYEMDIFSSEKFMKMDRSLAHEVCACDWNGDGYSDYLLSYVHNPSGNGNFAETKAMLAVVDGKSLCEGNPITASVPVDQCSAFSTTDWYSAAANFCLTMPNCLRMTLGDFDGDGVAEAALVFTKARPADLFEMGRSDMLVMYKIGAGSGAAPFTFAKKYDGEFCTWVSYWDGVGLAAGDVDNDGRDELATFGSRSDSGLSPSDMHISLKRWDGNGFVDIFSRELRNVYVPYIYKHMPPIHAALADLDGDGSAELLWAYMKGDQTSDERKDLNLWVHRVFKDGDNGIILGDASEYNTRDKLGWEPDTTYNKYSLATGLFHMDIDTSQSIITANAGIPKQVAVLMMGKAEEGNDKADLKWAILSGKADGALAKLGNGVKTRAMLQTDAVPVAAAVDSDRESVVLGVPTIFYITGDVEELMEAQAPPKHWDKIGDAVYDAFAWLSGYRTKISSSSGTSETTSVTHAGNMDFGYSESMGVSGRQMGAPPIFDVTAHIGDKIALEGTGDKSSSLTIKLDASAEKDDQIFSRINDYSMWRYPVIYPSADRMTVSGDQMFVQYVVPQETGDSFFPTPGRSVEWYEPLHDNYNIFTYPRELKGTAYYPDETTGGRVLAYATRQLFGNPDTASCQITVDEKTASAFMVDNTLSLGGSMTISPQAAFDVKDSPSVGGVYISYALNFDGVYNYSHVTASNLSKMNSVTVDWPGAADYISDGGFTLADQNFWGDISYYTRGDGTLCTSYAVSALKNANSKLWGGSSPYRQTPDPGLVLPFRVDNTSTRKESTAPNRHTIRGGLTLKNASGTPDPITNRSFLAEQIPGRAVSADSQVRCALRVVNYSFVDVKDPIHVEYLLQEIAGVSEAPDIAKAVSLASYDITAEISPGVIIPGRENVLSGDEALDNWIYDDTFIWQAPASEMLAYLHVRLTPKETQLSAANDAGHILVGVYKQEKTPQAAAMSALNIEVREIKDDGTLGEPLDNGALPRDTKLRVKFDVKGYSPEAGKKRFIRGLKFALVTDGGGLIAGRTIPMFDISRLDGLEMDFTPNAAHRPDGMKLMVYSPHTPLGRGNGAELVSFKFESGGSGGGCNAGWGILALFLLPLIKKKP
ncbi:MAG: VCBS repeat-containing protein [bacterium]|nr:VCBS repeat-containing protein [bacterium]